jgi:hypothetical protein
MRLRNRGKGEALPSLLPRFAPPDLEIRLPVDSKYSTDFPMSKVCRRASSNVPIR